VWNNNITDLTPLAGLKNLKQIIIYDNPELTRTEIDKLKAGLPNCVIRHNAKKL
jgi:Leucine-rich repeat (LRR) protein